LALQVPLQHSAFEVQALPAVLHCVLSGLQIPSVPQMVLQHSPPEVQLLPSEMQALALHRPATQDRPQQSPALWQTAPT
jgi:hypothetical protein